MTAMNDLTEWQIKTPDESENPLIEYLQEMERKRHESRKYLEAQMRTRDEQELRSK